MPNTMCNLFFANFYGKTKCTKNMGYKYRLSAILTAF